MKNKLQSRLLLIALLAGSLHVVCSNLAYGEEEVKTCYGACGSPANVSAGSTKCCPFPGGAYNCIKDDQECASGSGIGPGENDPCFKGFCSGNTDLTKCCAGEQGNLYCIKPSEECNEDDTSTTIEGAPFPATIEPNTRETNDQEKGKKKKKSKKKPRGKKDKEVLYGSSIRHIKENTAGLILLMI